MLAEVARRGRPRTRRRPEPGADHGVPAGEARASRRHQRRRRRSTGLRSKAASSSIGACVRHAAFHRPVVRRSARQAPERGRAPHRALSRSALAARSAAASRMPTPRPNGALVRRRSTATCWRKSARGERVIAARDFFQGIMTTALTDDELLAEARLPVLPAGTRCGFYEFSRRAGDFALADVARHLSDRGRQDRRAARCGRRRRASVRAASPRPSARLRAPNRATAFRAAAAAAAAVVDPMEDIVNTAEFRRDLVLRGHPPSARTRGEHERAAKRPWIGRSVARLEDPPLVTGPRPFAGDIQLSASAAHAHRALGPCAWPDRRRSTPRPRARCPACSRCGPRPTSPTCRRSIFATAASRRSSRIASRPGDRAACAMSASRSRPCSPTIPISPRTPPISSTIDIEELPPLLDADAAPGEFSPGLSTEATMHPPGLWRCRCRVPRRACMSSSSTSRSAATPACRWRRAAPSAATTPRATFSNCTAPPRCRTGTATCSRACSAAAVARSICYEGHVGGGFGIRGELYPEDVLVCVAALRLGRPVKWIEDRREHLIAANHSRQQLHTIRAAVDADGRILAIDDDFFHDQGAYVRTHATRVVHMTGRHAARALPRAGLSRGRPLPPHQQDAGGDLSGAGPLREHVRARAADRCDRRKLGIDPDRGAPPQPHHHGRDAVSRGRSTALGNEIVIRFRRLRRPARQGARRGSAGTSCKPS